MGGRSRAVQRREKKLKQQAPPSASSRTGQAATPSNKPQKRQQKSIYDSDSDSDDDTNRLSAIPLPSLEDGDKVRDFVQELEQAQKQQNKPKGKRARAEAEQHALDQRKKRYREEKAEKIVWRKFDRENQAFEKFYKRCLGLEAKEFERFLASLKEPLPVHLRVNGNYTSLSEIVTGTLEMDFDLSEVMVPVPVGGGETHVQFAPEDWASEKRLWKLDTDSKTFRKSEGLRSLSTYPGQRVLDLCGGGEHRAPIVEEYLNPPTPSSNDSDTSASAADLLVVNERDATAAASAVRNLTRTLPTTRELVVTAHKPEEFPVPECPEALFDRVICCAPCSGDGLIRKLPEKWRTWSPRQALAHHPSQLGLAEHALNLVRVDGVMLYSTRSMNPIENEAIVAELLRRSKGALELVETEDVLEGLQRSLGLTQWDVLDVPSWDDASEDQRHHLRPSMWPPMSKEREGMHLERCVRLLPHQNDTHGLFLAVIRKVSEADDAVVTAGPAPMPHTKSSATISTKNQKHKKNEKPFGSFTNIDKKHLASIRSFFSLRSDNGRSAFLERSGMARQKRAVHLVTPAVAQLVTNQLRGRLSVYHAGVDALRPGANAVADELTDDGARALLLEMKARVLSLPQEEFTSFLESREMWLKNAGEHASEQLAEMSEGVLAVALDDMEPAQTGDRDIVLVAVKRHNSCSIVSSSAAIARIKALLEELNDTGGDGEDGYDSFEFEE
ncbi:hypothetical protein BBO99_00000322 [Phytophthora kernoviae]|uniref:SAM-dependent MTase RsmB/NOP-type domain-containing protein n=2 Tax=Phytophthora kernoviae TaxID=325452 RepID=A0A421EZD5_9STRA|nr:hypothetical protein G195_000794 [Phytophthora kernoviae 00238/432]KAG2532807.1 hypothetical protein JM16_000080 [Phytophthora kernoviae]KAG2533530.1 hypothetical protein JM18_000082 [Phytophthora kernoviae]RLN11107.1 hypothetical protein BBI17_000139 [Phytophthora kernoviae]RLN86086.1 hypothetical protein BBO99_00000322 [Phytophthora kernoviae]